ncbi:MAG TPA: rhodanese-like domain-containing protein [Trichocoleus sp.]|jgi:rhodanese-related sulfurtransferase
MGNWLRSIAWKLLIRAIRRKFPTVQQISTQELANWLGQARTKPLLLDVRSPEEYAVSHLPDAQRIDPYTQDFRAFEGISTDRPIVAYCSVGYRSARLCDRLQAAGYENVRNLEGSIFQWVNEGRSVERAGQPVQTVHPYNARWGLLLQKKHWFEPVKHYTKPTERSSA